MKIRNPRLRGGHAPGHVRECFDAPVEAFLDWEKGPAPTVELEVDYEPTPIPISRACTLLWNCSDITSGDFCQRLRDDGGLDKTWCSPAHSTGLGQAATYRAPAGKDSRDA